MKLTGLSLIVALSLPAAAVVAAPPEAKEPNSNATPAMPTTPEPKASEKLDLAVDHLSKALFQTSKPADPAAARAAAVRSIEQAISILGPTFTASTRLQTVLTEVNAAPTDADALFRVMTGVKPVHADLTFRPTVEAPVPPGWPIFTPVNEIEVKSYPTYRAAFTTKKPVFFRESRNFWTLFNHISSRNIPMTAPVEMPMQVSGPGQLSEAGMAFLYPDTTTGQPGDTDGGAVSVIDVPPVTVVNIGIRGKSTESRIAAGHKALLEWLEANKDRYEPAGNPRVMGWNSPSMPDNRSYTEVQIPIKPRQ
jgi:hypothetical protein